MLHDLLLIIFTICGWEYIKFGNRLNTRKKQIVWICPTCKLTTTCAPKDERHFEVFKEEHALVHAVKNES